MELHLKMLKKLKIFNLEINKILQKWRSNKINFHIKNWMFFRNNDNFKRK